MKIMMNEAFLQSICCIAPQEGEAIIVRVLPISAAVNQVQLLLQIYIDDNNLNSQ